MAAPLYWEWISTVFFLFLEGATFPEVSRPAIIHNEQYIIGHCPNELITLVTLSYTNVIIVPNQVQISCIKF